jgi:hypothetical protein
MPSIVKHFKPEIPKTVDVGKVSENDNHTGNTSTGLRYYLRDKELSDISKTLRDMRDPMVEALTGSKLPFDPLQPARKPTSARFSIDVRSGASDEIYSSLLCGFKKGFESKYALCEVSTGLSFEQCPVNVERHGIKAQSFDLLKNIDPKTRYG